MQRLGRRRAPLGQLRGQSDEVLLLTAELLALIVLPLQDWKPATKLERVKAVLGLMREPVAVPEVVQRAYAQGGVLAVWRSRRRSGGPLTRSRRSHSPLVGGGHDDLRYTTSGTNR